MRGRRAAAIVIAASALLVGVEASAFVRTLTCNPSGGQAACEPGEVPIPIAWPAGCVVYHVNEVGTDDTDPDRANNAIVASFDAWNAPACAGIELVFGGFTDEDRVGYNPFTGQKGNGNIVVFRNDTWDHASGVLALTSVTFQPSTGIIFDADIELNGRDYKFTTTDDPRRAIVDVRNTVTHEAGHFLGLDHTLIPEATMFATAPIQELDKRDLDEDDIGGVCDAYPAGAVVSDGRCAGAPVGFFEQPLFGPDDGAPPPQARSCTCAQPGAPVSSAWVWGIALALGVAVRRRVA